MIHQRLTASKDVLSKYGDVTRPAGRRGPRLFGAACGVLLGGLLSSGAWAQASLSPAGPSSSNLPMVRGKGEGAEKPAAAPPDAIPGARARAPAAPAAKGGIDLAPSEALFDAINRGDIASARDALARGADLDAVNILGMTPMELSVDLGRNDISFLLLSMRGEDSGRGARSIGRGTPSQAASTTVSSGRHQVPAVARNKPLTTADKPVSAPKLFANDGGAPLPSAGFLGFDPHAAN